jgi:TetR/AcrR family transcriptional regulator
MKKMPKKALTKTRLEFNYMVKLTGWINHMVDKKPKKESDMRPQSLSAKRDKTRQRILDAAAGVFSKVGFAGARVDEIARRAGVNKAMIYYHIGDKEALYSEVLENILGGAFDRSLRDFQNARTPEEKLRVYITSIARTMDQHAHLAPIMLWEQASGGKNLPETIARVFASVVEKLTKILEEGERQGIFVKSVPFIVHSMVIGAIMFYKASDPVRTKYAVFPEALKKMDKKLSGGMAAEIEELVLRAIKK